MSEPTTTAVVADAEHLLAEVTRHPALRKVADTLAAAGHESFLVGGAVRDAALAALEGRTQVDFKDLDVTTGASVEQMAVTLPAAGKVLPLGEAFGILAVVVEHDGGSEVIEVAQFRTERYDADSRKPTVEAATTIEEDLARRDFTVNAMAVSLIDGRLIDPFDGMADLAAGVLRTPSDPTVTFSDDPLRVARLVRFAAVRGMGPAPETLSAAKSCADRLGVVSRERFAAELDKVLDADRQDALGVAARTALDCDATRDLLGLEAEAFTDQDLGRLDTLTGSATRLAALALLAARSGSGAFNELKLTKAQLGNAQQSATLACCGDELQVRLAARKASPEVLQAAHELARCFTLAGEGPLEQALAELDALQRPLPVNGEDALAAGLRGPAVGAALARVTEAFVKDLSLTRDAALALLAS